MKDKEKSLETTDTALIQNFADPVLDWPNTKIDITAENVVKH